MSLLNGQTIVEGDFVSSSGLAADENKVAKLNASGEQDNTFNGVIASDYDQAQTTRNAGQKVGEANSTGKQNILAQSFIPTARRIKGVTLYKDADSGSFTGTVTIALYASSGGSPTGSALATITITNAVWLLIPTGAFEVTFSTEYGSMVIGSLYWIRISTSTSDNTNHPNFGTNSAGGYGSGSAKYFNSTDNWVAIATVDLYFQTINGTNGGMLEGDTAGRLPVKALPYSLADVAYTGGSVSNSTTQTTVYTKVLPAGFFTTTSGFKLRGFFDSISLTGEGMNVTIELNGTTVFSLNSFNGGASSTSMQGFIDFLLQNQSSFSSQKMAYVQNFFNGNQSPATIAGAINVDLSQTSSVDTSGVVVLKVKIQITGSSSSCSLSYAGTILEKIG